MGSDFFKGYVAATMTVLAVVGAATFFLPSNSPRFGGFRSYGGESQNPGKGNAEIDPYIKGPVKNAIIKKFREIRECYVGFSEKTPGVSGRMKLDWNISSNGSSSKVEIVSSDFSSPEFEKCMTDKVSNFIFPRPPEPDYYVEHSFHFRPEGEDLPRPQLVNEAAPGN